MQHNHSNNIDLIATCLEQAGQICVELQGNAVIQSEGLKCYNMINQDAFAELLKKSQALINYINTFIFKNESHKISDVDRVGQYNMEKMDMYEQICYVT